MFGYNLEADCAICANFVFQDATSNCNKKAVLSQGIRAMPL